MKQVSVWIKCLDIGLTKASRRRSGRDFEALEVEKVIEKEVGFEVDGRNEPRRQGEVLYLPPEGE